jgi:hypothetical protein
MQAVGWATAARRCGCGTTGRAHHRRLRRVTAVPGLHRPGRIYLEPLPQGNQAVKALHALFSGRGNAWWNQTGQSTCLTVSAPDGLWCGFGSWTASN